MGPQRDFSKACFQPSCQWLYFKFKKEIGCRCGALLLSYSDSAQERFAGAWSLLAAPPGRAVVRLVFLLWQPSRAWLGLPGASKIDLAIGGGVDS